MGDVLSKPARTQSALQPAIWSVLVQDLFGNYRLHTIYLHPFATGREVGLALQAVWKQDVSGSALWFERYVLLGHRVVVIKPKKDFLLSVFAHDLEANNMAPPYGDMFELSVVVSGSDINDFLTSAMHDPASVTSAAIVDSFPKLSSIFSGEEAQILVLMCQPSKKAIAIATVVETSLILLVGLMVGVVKKDKVISLSIVLPALFVVLVLKAVAWKQSP